LEFYNSGQLTVPMTHIRLGSADWLYVPAYLPHSVSSLTPRLSIAVYSSDCFFAKKATKKTTKKQKKK
jgi:uncharacterized RmlC-like cupin family protein